MIQESIIKEEGDFGSIDGLLNSTSRILSNAFRAVRGDDLCPLLIEFLIFWNV